MPFYGRMKIVFCSLLIIFLLNFCNDNNTNSNKETFDNDALPISVQHVRNKDQVLIQIFPLSGFGIQIDAPNILDVEAKDGLSIVSKKLQFMGSPDSKKPEYYSSIQPMEIMVKGAGNISLKGKIFYCDFSKNICLPGRLSRTIEILNTP